MTLHRVCKAFFSESGIGTWFRAKWISWLSLNYKIASQIKFNTKIRVVRNVAMKCPGFRLIFKHKHEIVVHKLRRFFKYKLYAEINLSIVRFIDFFSTFFARKYKRKKKIHAIVTIICTFTRSMYRRISQNSKLTLEVILSATEYPLTTILQSRRLLHTFSHLYKSAIYACFVIYIRCIVVTSKRKIHLNRYTKETSILPTIQTLK